jgi:hypothetical protein
MAATTATQSAPAPIRSPFLVVLISWLVPGGGHFFLGRRGRGALICGSVLVTFMVGVLMRGPLFQPSGGADVLSRVIQYGGFLGDLATGIPYFVVSFLGYAPPDIAAHAADYGSKLIVAAGLLNILAIVDAYEITTRQKD